MRNDCETLLGIRHPIIQAPMAGGISGPALASAVSEAGGLGMLGAGYLGPEELRLEIRETKLLTRRPFGVNLFIPEKMEATEERLERAKRSLKRYREELGIGDETIQLQDENKRYKQLLNVAVEERVTVCSFTFGLPAPEEINLLKKEGIRLIGTATSVEEAIQAEKAGMDAIVVQGSEAGGHRGTFAGESDKAMIGLMALIPQVADRVRVPVIAAGAVMDGRGLAAALCLGASGVQSGTAFLVSKESGAHPLHKQAILTAGEQEPVLTMAFSGKPARGLMNRFIESMSSEAEEIAPYPYQHALTKGIRKAAADQNNKDYMSMWCGQAPTLSESRPAGEIIAEWISHPLYKAIIGFRS